MTIPGLWSDIQKFIYAESTTGFPGRQQVTKIVSSAMSLIPKSPRGCVFGAGAKTLLAEAGVGNDWKAVYVKNRG